MPKNAKAEARRESQLLRREDLKRCVVCGRHYFAGRKGWACSRYCSERLEDGQAPGNQWEKGGAGVRY